MLKRYRDKRRMGRGMEIEDSIMTVTQKEEAIIETPFERKGLSIIWYVIILAILMLFSRVFYLDIVKGKHYSQVSRENRIRSIIINAPRGNIVDKFGNILAKNIPSVDVIVIPSDLPADFEKRKNMAKILAAVLNADEGNIEMAVEAQNRQSLDPVLIQENISSDQALIISEKARDLPGINLYKTAIRNYENGMIFSSIIGYDGKITQREITQNKDYLMTDYIGKTGIEKSYESDLKGTHGAIQVEIDSLGNVKKNIGLINPQAGGDLILNIDEGLQKKLYDSLASVLESGSTKTAAAVAIDPRTGGILAMVSLPSYDNNLFARGISNDDYKNIISDKNLPLLNRVVAGEYPPGSTMKMAVAAAALTEGTITPDTSVSCEGGIHVGSWRFGDWKTHGADIDVRKAIAQSCDVFFYSVGGGYGNIAGLGMDRMKRYEDLFGFGQLTGIDLPGESRGFIPDEGWKLNKIKEKWYIGDSYHSSIGQGFITVTPLQLATYTASLANGGTLYSPKIVNRIKKGNEEKIISPEIIRRDFISKDVLNVIREGMKQTVDSGTAQMLNSLPVSAAGKTGTAQFGTENKTHAWFVSFAPYDNPEIAMVVLVEGEGEGRSSAVPVTKEAYEWYFDSERKDN